MIPGMSHQVPEKEKHTTRKGVIFLGHLVSLVSTAKITHQTNLPFPSSSTVPTQLVHLSGQLAVCIDLRMHLCSNPHASGKQDRGNHQQKSGYILYHKKSPGQLLEEGALTSVAIQLRASVSLDNKRWWKTIWIWFKTLPFHPKMALHRFESIPVSFGCPNGYQKRRPSWSPAITWGLEDFMPEAVGQFHQAGLPSHRKT